MSYFIWSNEHNSWWMPNMCGYTKDVGKAGVYSRQEALDVCNGANYSWNMDRLKYIPSELPIHTDIAHELKHNTRNLP